jgi:spermidine/putrescine transport system permease protein
MGPSRTLQIYAFGFVLFLYGPVLLLPIFSFNDNIYIMLPLRGFTFEWYRQMVANKFLIEALENSIVLATATSLITTAIGTLAAIGLRHHFFSGRGPVLALMSLPLLIPPAVLGIGLLFLARTVFAVQLSLFTIGVAHISICLPFAVLTLLSRLQGMDKSLEEASRDLGEGPIATFLRVTLPLALPGVISSILLCFTISFDEFVLAFFLGGNEPTLPVFIFSQLRFPNRLPGVLALGSCILIVSFTMVAASEWTRRLGTGQVFWKAP